MTFRAAATINAPAAQVWATLLSLSSWTSWDPALESVSGELGPSGRITLRVTNNPRPFRLAVRNWRPEQALTLAGGMPLGLFTGTRTYTLREEAGATHFVMEETYSGLLRAAIVRSIPDLQPSFDSFVAGLKAEAESTQKGTS